MSHLYPNNLLSERTETLLSLEDRQEVRANSFQHDFYNTTLTGTDNQVCLERLTGEPQTNV